MVRCKTSPFDESEIQKIIHRIMEIVKYYRQGNLSPLRMNLNWYRSKGCERYQLKLIVKGTKAKRNSLKIELKINILKDNLTYINVKLVSLLFKSGNKV